MKLALPLGLIVAAATSLACSSDEGTDRNNGGTAGTGTGNAGTGTGGTGTGGTGTGGTGTGGTGATPTYTYGSEFTITAEGNVIDEAGTSGVNGGTFLTQSENMTVDATTAHRAEGLCFSGTTAIVPDANSYGTYWGAELGLNLKLIPDPDAPPVAADAGADAGAPALIPDPAGWPYGTAIGFSFKLVGNDPAAPDKGVPTSRIRFKALPTGSDPMQDNYCSNLEGTIDGQTVNVLFSAITFECWTMNNQSIAGDNITRVDVGPPRLTPDVPNPKALQNISWQIASDVMATTPLPIAFNFCIEDLKPITGM